jgi:hypothetical protein
MSRLRDHLDAAAKEYGAQRYPGDLAGDVLDRPLGRIGPRQPLLKIAGGLIVAGVIAAAIVIALRTTPTETSKTWIARPNDVAKVDLSDEIALSPGEVPSWTDVATGVSFAASSPTFTFNGAEASSFDDSSSDAQDSSSDSSQNSSQS